MAAEEGLAPPGLQGRIKQEVRQKVPKLVPSRFVGQAEPKCTWCRRDLPGVLNTWCAPRVTELPCAITAVPVVHGRCWRPKRHALVLPTPIAAALLHAYACCSHQDPPCTVHGARGKHPCWAVGAAHPAVLLTASQLRVTWIPTPEDEVLLHKRRDTQHQANAVTVLQRDCSRATQHEDTVVITALWCQLKRCRKISLLQTARALATA